jgi:predicted DNA-binding transcriptional regulator AlpA
MSRLLSSTSLSPPNDNPTRDSAVISTAQTPADVDPQCPGTGPPRDFAELPPPLLMTANEVMHALRVSRRMIYYFIEEGLLHPVRIGQRITRYRSAEVVAIANAGWESLRLPGQLKNHRDDGEAA